MVIEVKERQKLTVSDLKANARPIPQGFAISGYEEVNYDFHFIPSVFNLNPQNNALALLFEAYSRCLLVTDTNIDRLYGQQMRKYFESHGIPLTFFAFPGGELNKNPETLFNIIEAFNKFGLLRKEPVFVVGGGMVTDVAGLACAMFRRGAQYVRIPTSLVGLIDAGISIKVAVNYGKGKNRLGAFHPPLKTLLDFSFLRSLSAAQIRNGLAEIYKIASIADLETWQLLVEYGERLLETSFGYAEGTDPAVRDAADKIAKGAIDIMLRLEVHNLHEIGLDRPMRLGHIWSVTLELATPVPLRHGHAVSIDMAYTATLAYLRGYITAAQRNEIIAALMAVGLSVDHRAFTHELLVEATTEILQIHDGQLRAPAYHPIGSCHFINDASMEELADALNLHKEVISSIFPRGDGEGVDAYVDESDMGV